MEYCRVCSGCEGIDRYWGKGMLYINKSYDWNKIEIKWCLLFSDAAVSGASQSMTDKRNWARLLFQFNDITVHTVHPFFQFLCLYPGSYEIAKHYFVYTLFKFIDILISIIILIIEGSEVKALHTSTVTFISSHSCSLVNESIAYEVKFTFINYESNLGGWVSIKKRKSVKGFGGALLL